MLTHAQLHPTQVAQYDIDLLQIQRANGYLPAPGAVQPQAYVQAEQALDARYTAETTRLNAIDQQAAQRAQQRPRVQNPAHAPRWSWGPAAGIATVVVIVILGAAWLTGGGPFRSATNVVQGATPEQVKQAIAEALKQQSAQGSAPDKGETESVAASAYKALGPAPNGKRLESFTIQAKRGPGRLCDDGSKPIRVKSAADAKYFYDRWHCPNDTPKS
ncbi:MAG: hypothetical protein Q7S05_04740 [bacterium]|nr:hypothetical protein [bacterium]